MKHLSILIISAILASFLPDISRAGMFDFGKDDIFPRTSSDFTIDCCAMINPLPDLGMNHSQDFTDHEHIDVFLLNRGSEGLSLLNISDGPGLGGRALFITGPITRTQNSIPDSSTMLLLGLSLVGLSGYFGRKKFKR